MSLQRPRLNPYSRPGLSDIPSALDVETNVALDALKDNLDTLQAQWGPMVTPAQNLAAALSCLDDDGILLLLPGTYQIRADLTLTRGCKLVGIGAVTLQLAGSHRISLQGAHCGLADLRVACNDPIAPDVILVAGEHCRLDRLDVATAGDVGVRIAASHCLATGLRFHEQAAPVTGSDVYVEDAATYATICATSWSTTRTFALSYKGGSNASEAANGPASIIEVR